MTGKWDPATKTITFTGKTIDPTTGKEIDVRQNFAIINENTQKIGNAYDRWRPGI
jgi:hypothetical protein